MLRRLQFETVTPVRQHFASLTPDSFPAIRFAYNAHITPFLQSSQAQRPFSSKTSRDDPEASSTGAMPEIIDWAQLGKCYSSLTACRLGNLLILWTKLCALHVLV